MITELEAISPIAFMLAKEGDVVTSQRTTPKKNEYREKIGVGEEAILIFKGQTKIGMIPKSTVSKFGISAFSRKAKITEMDESRNKIFISITVRPTPHTTPT